MKKTFSIAVVLSIFLLSGCGAKTENPAAGENPFFVEWTTPFGVPPFGDIENEDFLPAFEKGIAEERAEVEAIAPTRIRRPSTTPSGRSMPPGS